MKLDTFLLIFFTIFQSAISARAQPEDANIKQKVKMCGGVFAANSFFLESPNYPQNYFGNLNCVYILEGPNCPTYYKFDFIDFHLENSIGCVKDRLIIENQDALCGRGGLKGNKGYFANNGSLNVRFITDDSGYDTGFRIFVTRMDCENAEDKEEMTTEATEMINFTTSLPQMTTATFRPFNLPLPNPGVSLPQCCSNIFNSRRFLITSPNFPYTLNTKQECVIKIQKSNKNICRLRLSFLFFWLGSTNYNSCPYGWLRIDGKFICGCNKELKLTTTFENEDIKELVFRSEGVVLNSQSGFVIEVIQDECPTKYHPQEFSDISKMFTYNNVVPQRYGRLTVDGRAEQQPYIETAQLITEKTEIVDIGNESKSRSAEYPRLIRSFYYFSEPDYNALPIIPREQQPTTFIDTSTISVIVTNTNQLECTKWNNVQIIDLCNRYGTNLQTCRRTADNSNNNNGWLEQRSNCVELDFLRGYFKSPGYPFYYPKKLNICYRFRKQSGYCGVRLFMTDFQLQNNYGCTKDYVLVENRYRYCGKSLQGRYLTFDLTNKPYEDLVFVTDYFFCGRGFYGVYEQLLCQEPTTTNPITIAPTTKYPITFVPTTTTTEGPVICDRYIPDQLFVFEVTQDAQRCTFQIRKFSEDACKVRLYFEQFDLYCGSESLVVDNNMFCGHLTGRKVTVNFDDYNELITVVYRSSLQNKYGNFKFKISGEQITDDCLIPQPPVQRLITKNTINVTSS